MHIEIMEPSTLIGLAIVYSILFVVALICLTAWIASWIVQEDTESFEYNESVQAYRKITKVDSTNSYDNLDWVDIKQTFINLK